MLVCAPLPVGGLYLVAVRALISTQARGPSQPHMQDNLHYYSAATRPWDF